MKVSVIGIGDMGLAMAGHIQNKGLDVTAYDVSEQRIKAAEDAGVRTSTSFDALIGSSDVFLLMVATDAQVSAIARQLADGAREGATVIVAATVAPETIHAAGVILEARGKRLVDAPVVYGASGARDGTLLSLCGGSEEDVERVRPVMMSYSQDVVYVGPLGAGQVAKACNNLLHWVHCVSNFETLLIAKSYGLDAQRMREVLLMCPATNGTLRRWDTTRFTWHEKDMDLTMDMAQKKGLVLPLAGQVDQLVKTLTPDDVKGLLYGSEATYLGVKVEGPAKGFSAE